MQMSKSNSCLAGLLLLVATAALAQGTDDLAKATNFSIPSAPAFTLLDATPSKINVPNYPRDFSLDWIVKDDRLVSDIAIDAQPVWLLWMRNKDTQAYKDAGRLMRFLSTLSTSLGTAKRDDEQSLAAAVKFSPFRGTDPLLDTGYIDDITGVVRGSSTVPLLVQKAILEVQVQASDDAVLDEKQVKAIDDIVDASMDGELDLDEVQSYSDLSAAQRAAIRAYTNDLKDLAVALASELKAKSKKLTKLREQFEKDHWNDSRLDIGIGWLSTYQEDATLDELKLVQDGFGVWVNPAYGFGSSHFLGTALVKVINRDDTDWSVGANLRYGQGKRNFFAEYVLEQPGADGADSKQTISYGGEFKVGDAYFVQFGLRTEYEDGFDLQAITPTVKVNSQVLNSLF